VIAVILDNFENGGEEDNHLITEDHIEQFKVSWAQVDPTASKRIHKDQLVVLVRNLEPPLGLGPGAPELKLINFCRQLGLEPENDYYQFENVLTAVTRHVFDTHSTSHNDLSDALRVLEPRIVQSLTPKELRKAGLTINRMTSAGFNKEEIRAVVSVLHAEKPTTKQLQAAFKVFDEDGSGLLDRQEFQQLLFIALPEVRKNKIDNVFNLADKDGSGQVDLEEFEWILHNIKVEGREIIARTVTLSGIRSALSDLPRRMSVMISPTPKPTSSSGYQKSESGGFPQSSPRAPSEDGI